MNGNGHGYGGYANGHGHTNGNGNGHSIGIGVAMTPPRHGTSNDDGSGGTSSSSSSSSSSSKYDGYLTYVLWALLLSVSTNLFLVLRYYNGVGGSGSGVGAGSGGVVPASPSSPSTAPISSPTSSLLTSWFDYNTNDGKASPTTVDASSSSSSSTSTTEATEQQQVPSKRKIPAFMEVRHAERLEELERRQRLHQQQQRELDALMERRKNQRHHHAILIPYRNREYHLQNVTAHLSNYFTKHFNSPDGRNKPFHLWIVEQANNQTFNKGWLGNIGLTELMKHDPNITCIIWHDVDLIPDDTEGIVPYDTCTVPIQLGSELEHFAYFIPSVHFNAGGIISLNVQHWKQVNGFSNQYVGWGGEDDDLFFRLKNNNLLKDQLQWGPYEIVTTITRPKLGSGVFHVIHENATHHPPKVVGNYTIINNILADMKKGSNRWKYDGLSTTKYKLLNDDEIQSLHDIGDSTGYKIKTTDELNLVTDGFASVHHLFAVPPPKTSSNSVASAPAPAS